MLFYDVTATVNRMTYVGDKSTYSSVGTVEGYLEPVEKNKELIGHDSILGQEWMFRCNGDEDIREADKLTIDSVSYAVSGVRRYTAGTLDLLDVMLERSPTR